MKTVSLELSKELKKAGYPQKGERNWRYNENPNDAMLVEFPFESSRFEFCAAPTADEILDILPFDIIGDEGMRFDLNIYRELNFGRWVVCYWWDEDSRRKSGEKIENIEANTLADAAALMWLYLKEKELLS